MNLSMNSSSELWRFTTCFNFLLILSNLLLVKLWKLPQLDFILSTHSFLMSCQFSSKYDTTYFGVHFWNFVCRSLYWDSAVVYAIFCTISKQRHLWPDEIPIFSHIISLCRLLNVWNKQIRTAAFGKCCLITSLSPISLSAITTHTYS